MSLVSFGRANFFAWMIYVLFYPFLQVFWKLPRYIIIRQKWVLAVAILNLSLAWFQSLKYNSAILSLWLISFVVAIYSSNTTVVTIAAVLLAILISIVFINKFISVFRYSSISRNFGAALTELQSKLESPLEEEIRNLPAADANPKQLEKRISSLQGHVLMNRLCLFAARRVRDYENSGAPVIGSVIRVLSLIAAVIATFAAINFALFTVDPHNFEFSRQPSFFTFIYYSFNNFVFSSIKDFEPNTGIAQFASMAERILALLTGAILAALILSVQSARYSQELNKIIILMEEAGKKVERFIAEQYHVSDIEAAMAELEKFKSSMLRILLYLTRSSEPGPR